MEKKTLLLVGVGLIGASLAKAIKQTDSSCQIFGYDTHTANLASCLKMGIIDVSVSSLAEGACLADYIIFCTPVKQTVNYLADLSHLSLKPEVIVSDVGSSKKEVMHAATALTAKGICFIGGHPMAGSHKSSFLGADVDLFENAIYVLIPAEDNPIALTNLTTLLINTRANFITLTAEEHDEITAMVSHLPHVLAATLVNQMADFSRSFPLAEQLAAGGFRDITRIASSDPQMWTDILLSNQSIILDKIAGFQQELQQLTTYLEKLDQVGLYTFFKRAKQQRDNLPLKKAGAMPAFQDLFVEVPDYAGEIAEVTRVIAEEKLSLTNLKILENREDIYGTLQLTFKHAKDVKIGQQALKRHGYRCYEKE